MKKVLLTLVLLISGLYVFSQASVYPPTLNTPANGTNGLAPNAFLKWNAVPGAFNYKVVISDDSLFATTYQTHITNLTAVNASHLFFNTTYYWKVKAYGATDSSAWSDTWSLTSIDVVTLINPVNGSIDHPVRTWFSFTPITGLDSYQYEVDTAMDFSSPLYLSGNVVYWENAAFTKELYFGEHYYLRIRACHPADTSGWSVLKDFNTLNDFNLRRPLNDSLNAMPVVKLIWDWVGSRHYDYYISTDSTFATYDMYTVDSSNKVITVSVDTAMLTHTDTLLFGTTYYWKVQARSNFDVSNFTVTRKFTIRDTTRLKSPVNLTMNVTTIPLLEWKAYGMVGLKAFQIYMDTSALFTNPIMFTAYDTTYQITEPEQLLGNRNYHWKVRMISGADTSEFSEPWMFRTTGQIGFEEQELSNSNISIYPNPTYTGKINISINAPGEKTIDLSISNMIGQVVYNNRIQMTSGNHVYNIDLTSLENGIYFVKLQDNNDSFTRKIIINK